MDMFFIDDVVIEDVDSSKTQHTSPEEKTEDENALETVIEKMAEKKAADVETAQLMNKLNKEYMLFEREVTANQRNINFLKQIHHNFSTHGATREVLSLIDRDGELRSFLKNDDLVSHESMTVYDNTSKHTQVYLESIMNTVRDIGNRIMTWFKRIWKIIADAALSLVGMIVKKKKEVFKYESAVSMQDKCDRFFNDYVSDSDSAGIKMPTHPLYELISAAIFSMNYKRTDFKDIMGSIERKGNLWVIPEKNFITNMFDKGFNGIKLDMDTFARDMTSDVAIHHPITFGSTISSMPLYSILDPNSIFFTKILNANEFATKDKMHSVFKSLIEVYARSDFQEFANIYKENPNINNPKLDKLIQAASDRDEPFDFDGYTKVLGQVVFILKWLGCTTPMRFSNSMYNFCMMLNKLYPANKE